MSYFEKVSTITVLTPNARDMAITALFDAAYAGGEVPTLKPEEKNNIRCISIASGARDNDLVRHAAR